VNAAFSQAQVDKILAAFRLPFNTPLSVLVVELFNSESLVIGEQGFNADDLELNNANKARLLKNFSSSNKTAGGGNATVLTSSAAPNEVSTRATAAAQVLNDPLGQELGSQRILRVSPLTPVRAIC
jgi:hypothetical protein